MRFQCAPERFPVTADALRLRQALDNLLSNALKYSDGPVVVRLSAGPQNYLVEVSDEGIGIPADDQAGIFEPFFRASNTGSKPGHGPWRRRQCAAWGHAVYNRSPPLL